VAGEPLARIEEQLRGEVGESWKTDEELLKGRNAVRREHGLPLLGETNARPAPPTPNRRPLWRRVLGR
jgi:hypothetical protein